jgi:hypothetical protein
MWHAKLLTLSAQLQPERRCATCHTWHDHSEVTNIEDCTHGSSMLSGCWFHVHTEHLNSHSPDKELGSLIKWLASQMLVWVLASFSTYIAPSRKALCLHLGVEKCSIVYCGGGQMSLSCLHCAAAAKKAVCYLSVMEWSRQGHQYWKLYRMHRSSIIRMSGSCPQRVFKLTSSGLGVVRSGQMALAGSILVWFSASFSTISYILSKHMGTHAW